MTSRGCKLVSHPNSRALDRLEGVNQFLEKLWFEFFIRWGSRLASNREVPIEADVQVLEVCDQRFDAFKVLGAPRAHILQTNLQAIAFARQAQNVT
jgi:hypothetical protein